MPWAMIGLASLLVDIYISSRLAGSPPRLL